MVFVGTQTFVTVHKYAYSCSKYHVLYLFCLIYSSYDMANTNEIYHGGTTKKMRHHMMKN